MKKSKNNKIPSLANWLITKLLDEEYLEEFLGDLQEMYEERRQEKNTLYARFFYWIDAFHLLFGFTSFKIFKSQHTNWMLKNMFKIAWRNALRQKQYTALNLLGLTLGIATCFVIGLYVHHESTFDRFYENADRIYRVNQPNIWGDWEAISSATGPNVATALKADIPEFEEVTRIANMGYQTVKVVDEKERMMSFQEDAFFLAEENFLNVFSFEVLEGNAEAALKDPSSLIMTRETSERYFGFDDPLGQLVEVRQWDGTWRTFTVGAIIANHPDRSHIQFDMLGSLSSMDDQMKMHGWKWIWTIFSTYVLVQEGTDIAALTDKIQAVPPKWAPPTTEQIFNQTFDEFTAGYSWKLYLQPLKDIYLSAAPDAHNFGPTGNPQFVKLFIAIGLLVLLLSSINFMNLSTARSSNRAKEVGIRKVMGSRRKSLVGQFVFESTLYVFVSTILGLGIVELSLPMFNSLSGTQLELLPYFGNYAFVGLVISFILLLGILAGSYPAFYLSAFNPIQTLKGKVSAGFKGAAVRNGLVVFQFTISIVLIICAVFVQKQLAFTSTIDVGFAKENVLQIHNIEQFGFETEAIKNQLATYPEIVKTGKSFGLPPNIWSGDRYKDAAAGNEVLQFRNVRTEADYLDLLGVEFLDGRNFDEKSPADRLKVILNEEAVRQLGWDVEESPIGKKVALASGDEDEFEVIGVVKDFNFNSLKQKIDPLIIIHQQNNTVWDYGAGLSFYALRLNPGVVKSAGELQKLLDKIKEDLKKIDPAVPFEYSFMDQQFEASFRFEQQIATILNVFTLMAFIIACLGLFGLAAFSAEQRIKELGIRKVLGASVSQLVLLFSTEFTKLILVSVLLASPIAWFLVSEWLKDFAYQTPIDLWVFVAAASGALVISFLTISYQSLSAAYKNPVDTLKSE
ncbi:ABC transporter permease [Flammeovirgaceae bacterium SG7u.111]|nr:ABC transporter permease [Flammeovirgaceae bacterium SG7u.132]WPO36028.1 ABC transporter permease [Flammeovirgaceae bacterium SG7u.111]